MWREVSAVRRALEHYGVKAGSTVADVPCGTGVAAPAFAAVGASVTAVDISREMMSFAGDRYASARLTGFVQGDITALPFPDCAFDATVVLGFMHRVPPAIKSAALAEIARVSSRVAVVSFSVDGLGQRVKRRIIGVLKPRHKFAPAPSVLRDIQAMVSASGFRIVRVTTVAPLLSAEVVLVLERVGRSPIETCAA
jgi:ubiquinone/menaquinone biosynthesis C-methylase UbiE